MKTDIIWMNNNSQQLEYLGKTNSVRGQQQVEKQWGRNGVDLSKEQHGGQCGYRMGMKGQN